MFKNEKLNIIFKYSSIKYLALIIGFIKGMVNASVLGPEMLGVLGNLLLIIGYLSYSNFGILYAMNREYAIHEMENNIEGTRKVLETAFSTLLLLLLFLVFVGLLLYCRYTGEIRQYIFLVFLIGALEQYKLFFINYFRLVNDFDKINLIEIIDKIFSFAIIVVSISYLKIYSVLIAMVAVNCLIFSYGYKYTPKLNFIININELKTLLKVGIPLLIYNLGFYILTTIDRIMIIDFLGYKDLGFYTFSNQIVNGTLVFISSILFLYYPKAIQNLNLRNNNINKVLVSSEQYTRHVEVTGVLLCMCGSILIEPLVFKLFPEYIPSINIYRVLILGMVASQIPYFFNVFIVSNNKQIFLVFLQIVTVVLAILINYIFIKLGMKIIGIAVGNLIVNLLYSVLQYEIYLRILKIEKNHIKNIMRIYKRYFLYASLSLGLIYYNGNLFLYSLGILVLTMGMYYKDFRILVRTAINDKL